MSGTLCDARQLLLFAVVTSSCLCNLGCGLILYSPEQTVRIDSAPRGVTVSGETISLTTPAEITVARRPGSTDSVLRFKKTGYYSTCQLLEWEWSHGLITLEAFPAAIPLLIDLAFRSRPGQYKDLMVTMEERPAGSEDTALPPTDQVLDARRNGIDLCELAPLSKIIVSPTGIDRAHEILGPVQVSEADFRARNLPQTMENLDMLLRTKAAKLYGSHRVDAIIGESEHYTGPSLGFSIWLPWGFHEVPGTASARGIAVRFTGAGTSPPSARAGTSGATRLRELQQLLDQGLISRDEFERKRAQILNDL